MKRQVWVYFPAVIAIVLLCVAILVPLSSPAHLSWNPSGAILLVLLLLGIFVSLLRGLIRHR